MFTYKLTCLNIFHLQNQHFLLYSTSKPTFSYYIPPPNQYFLIIHIPPPNQYFLIHLKTNILKRIFHLQTIIFLLYSTSKPLFSYCIPPPNQYCLTVFHLQTNIFFLYSTSKPLFSYYTYSTSKPTFAHAAHEQ